MRSAAVLSQILHAWRCAMVACWGLALLAGTQGWSLRGSDLFAGGGASFWTRCGSAMCACGPDAWPVVAGLAEVAEEPEDGCCSLDPEPGLERNEPTHDHARGGSGSIGFVAFGSHRRHHSDGTPLPELHLLPLTVSSIDLTTLEPLGLLAAQTRDRDSGRALDITPPPPRLA